MALTKENSAKRVTYKERLKREMLSLAVGQSIDIDSFILENWGENNYYIKRSFDVYLAQCRKELKKEQPEITYKRGKDDYGKSIIEKGLES